MYAFDEDAIYDENDYLSSQEDSEDEYDFGNDFGTNFLPDFHGISKYLNNFYYRLLNPPIILSILSEFRRH
jgi:hypothetical protein